MSIKKTYHKIIIKEKVLKFLKKLDKKLKERSVDAIYKLEKNPIPKDSKHIIDVKNHRMLCELSVDKLRFYYEVVGEKIIFDNVEFIGSVEIFEARSNHKSGNKKNNPNQQKFINWLKKIFRK